MNTSPYEDYKSAVLDLFGKRPRGVSAADVAKHIGLSRDQTLFWLRKMRKEGLAEPTPCGHVALWSTPERCKVLTKIAAGVPLTEIGVQLCVSVKTIGTHRQRILEKIGVQSNAELVQYALRHGLID